MKRLFKILRQQEKIAITLMQDNIDNDIIYTGYRVMLSHIRWDMYMLKKC